MFSLSRWCLLGLYVIACEITLSAAFDVNSIHADARKEQKRLYRNWVLTVVFVYVGIPVLCCCIILAVLIGGGVAAYCLLVKKKG